MCVLSRQAGESIMVGDDVEVVVVAIEHSKVALDVRHTTLRGRMTHNDSYPEAVVGEVLNLPAPGSCTVVDIRGDKVRLGMDAPKDVSIHRKEVWEAIRRENRRERGLD